MEAGSNTRILNGIFSIQDKEIFFFLSLAIILPSLYLTNNSYLISFLQKGIMNSVLSAFIFLFFLSASPVSSLLQLPLNKNVKPYSDKIYDFASVSFNSTNHSIKTIYKEILHSLFTAPKQPGLKETPGIISLEAPSSRFDIQDTNASNSCMLNQITGI